MDDLRAAVRHLARRPGFTLLATGTLALGLIASTTVYTYVQAYTRAFPGTSAEDLRQVYLASEDDPYAPLSYPDYEDLQARLGGELDIVAISQSRFAASVRHDILTEVVFGRGVTGGYFETVGAGLALGRGIMADDDRPGASPVVVISHEYWTRRYASDPEVLGETILLNNEAYAIVGVAAPDFLGASSSFRPQVWFPFEHFTRVYWARSDMKQNREARAILPIVRMDRAADEARLEAGLTTLAAALDEAAPLPERTRRFVAAPATWISPATRDAEASTTRLMALAAVTLLLLACANVASLTLSMGTRRSGELALKRALGSTRGRLVRQLLTESVIIAGMGSLLALTLAGPAANRLSSYFARPSVWGSNVAREITVEPGVLGFAALAALAAGLVTGILPALSGSGAAPGSSLASTGARSASDRTKTKGWSTGPGGALVATQVGLSVVLLFVAGLVLRTLDAAQTVAPGFAVDGTLSSYVSTSSMGVPVEERHAFFEELIRRFEALPWVDAATVAEQAPLSPHPTAELRTDDDEPLLATVARVWPGYFEILDVSLTAGRVFTRSDTVDAAGVAVVNETLAGRIDPGGAVVGRTLRLPTEDDPGRAFEIVGVVTDMRQTTLLDGPEPVVYFSLPQHYSAPGNAFLVRTRGDPARAVELVEAELRAVDTRIAIVNILPYRDVMRGFLYTQRMNAELFGVIAGLGLFLAAAGLFGVVTLALGRRRREIGIRLAIGATPGSVVRLVGRTIAWPVLLGLVAGGIGAWLAAPAVESVLWGVEPGDPVALVGGAVILLTAVLLAVTPPLIGALRANPARSLRVE